MAGPDQIVPPLPTSKADGVAAGRMEKSSKVSRRPQFAGDVLEIRELVGSLCGGVVGRRCKMRHQALETRMRRLTQYRDDFSGARAGAEAAHAGIDFQVVTERLAGGFRQPVDVTDLRERVDYRRKVIIDQ